MHRQSTQNLARAVSQLRSRLAMETPTIVRCRRVSAAHSVVGRPAKRTSGFAHTDMNGTLSIREEYALPAYTSGLRPSASHAPGGLRTRSGISSDFRNEIVIIPHFCGIKRLHAKSPDRGLASRTGWPHFRQPSFLLRIRCRVFRLDGSLA